MAAARFGVHPGGNLGMQSWQSAGTSRALTRRRLGDHSRTFLTPCSESNRSAQPAGLRALGNDRRCFAASALSIPQSCRHHRFVASPVLRSITHPSDRGHVLTTKTARNPERPASQDANRVAPTQRRKEEHSFVDGDPPPTTETADQDRLFDLNFNEDGLREQWLPTHPCSREIKRGVMENLV